MNQEKSTTAEAAAAVQPFVITRTLNAPRDLVWKAWTEPERLAQWWGPKGCTIKVHQLDLRPGGIFHYTMSFPGGGDDMWCRFAFREVTPPQRIVWVNSFSDAEGGITRPPFDDNWPLEILNEVTLTEENGKTQLTLHATPINATAEEVQTFDTNRASLNQGYSGTWDQLEEYLASIA
ncbi:SRPBCC domain-containing protein [Roseimicrobium sp. ORNL1]|uniref:SRPBCC family protein n=1 Tax=Roseimicrobium sp. ORNL1 TaxID=2711231 RepID=UPI0013E0F75B|nr:SRPBCC domain-containing protein [Roseimicrobium sp. ORNL1]QIF04703.1 SRPBCC domain-containing protein [Roseimicrobium sp. ORNL1]